MTLSTAARTLEQALHCGGSRWLIMAPWGKNHYPLHKNSWVTEYIYDLLCIWGTGFQSTRNAMQFMWCPSQNSKSQLMTEETTERVKAHFVSWWYMLNFLFCYAFTHYLLEILHLTDVIENVVMISHFQHFLSDLNSPCRVHSNHRLFTNIYIRPDNVFDLFTKQDVFACVLSMGVQHCIALLY